MRTIYKYQLALSDKQQIQIPEKHDLLSVQFQNGALCLWAEVDTDFRTITREIVIIGTGNLFPKNLRLLFIDTVQRPPFVWHVYKVLDD